MAFQTTYTRAPSGKAFSGQPGDTGDRRAESYLNDEGSSIPAGIAVTLKAEGTVEEYDSTGDTVLGISMLSFDKDPSDTFSDTPDAIANGKMLNVLTEGAIWVQIEEDIAVTDAVYVRATSDGSSNTQLGRFRNDSDSGKCAALVGARWLSSGTSGGCALLYFSRSAQGAA